MKVIKNAKIDNEDSITNNINEANINQQSNVNINHRIHNLNNNKYLKNNQETISKEFNELSPDNLPKMTPPLKKLNLPNEEIIPVQEIKSDSVYNSYKNGNLFNRLDAKNLINNEDIWCSSGNHGVKDEIKIKFAFEDNYRMHSLWFYWAFAPGEFRIQYSNDNINYFDIFPKTNNPRPNG